MKLKAFLHFLLKICQLYRQKTDIG